MVGHRGAHCAPTFLGRKAYSTSSDGFFASHSCFRIVVIVKTFMYTLTNVVVLYHNVIFSSIIVLID